MKTIFAHWKAAFLTGLAVMFPAVVSIALIIWLFGLAAHFTDSLLVFVPEAWTHAQNGGETSRFVWSLLSLGVAILLVSLIGGLARYYFGKKLIQLADAVLMRVPLLNKIYSLLKQVNEAFSSHQAAAFKQVVLVEFPRAGLYSIGFLTGRQNGEVQARTHKALLSVFVPTPPLTSGSIVLAPEADVLKLDMSVADGIKFIMSLGSVSPPSLSQANLPGLATAGSRWADAFRNDEAMARVGPEPLTLFDVRVHPEFLSLPHGIWCRFPQNVRTDSAC
jgi:uncharacterized membrane protein